MSELDDVLPKGELDEDAIQKGRSKDFKADPRSLDELVKSKEGKKGRGVKKSSLANLRQYSKKEVSDEAKENMLKNLRPNPSRRDEFRMPKDEFQLPDTVKNQELIKNCLTKDELLYFKDRWEAYYAEYGDDLNDANDYDQLLELIMNYIDLYRIQKKKKNTPSLISDPAVADIQHKSSNRIQSLLTSLRTRRKDRHEDNHRKEENVFKLMCSMAKGDSDFHQRVDKMLEDYAKEEMDFIKAKQERKEIADAEIIVDPKQEE